jgi:WD40 repeat protein
MGAKKKASYERRIAKDWSAVSSFAIAPDGRMIAGENGGTNVLCWAPDGSVAWTRSIGKKGNRSAWEYEVGVVLTGDVVLAQLKGTATIFALDLATGEVEGKHEVPKGTRTFAFAPDGKTLVVRVETETMLLDYPSFEEIAKFEEYCNMNHIATSSDGKWLAVNGHEVHVYDLQKRKHVKTFEPPESPWDLVFTPSGHLISGDDDSIVRIYHSGRDFALVKEIKPPSARKPTITALAANDKLLAVGTEDGTIRLRELGDFEIVREIKGHDTSQPDTGAKDLPQMAFDGSGLVVACGMKKEPAGLTIHPI